MSPKQSSRPFNPDDTGSDEESALTIIFSEGRPTVKHLRKAKLVVLSGNDQGEEVEIDRSRVSGGRSVVNDLTLNDKAVSGAHFEIFGTDEGYRLVDLDSTNGTFVDGLRIKEVYLKPGLEFQAGHTTIRFQPTNEVVEIALSKADRFGDALGSSVAMREVFAVLEKVAPSDMTVLISGGTGTGKEVVARAIHDKSKRSDGPFVVLDCGAIPKELIESTLFGHEKGAFTGAVGQRRGCFEQAQGGTIFLDEIGELDLSLQPKLLRVLENRELKRVGGSKTIGVDVRVLAATNRDLRRMVSEGSFREDLYFRLSVMQVELPPLKERAEDIELLARRFLQELAHGGGTIARSFSAEAVETLMRHDWPGNVRELRNVVERAASLADGPEIQPSEIIISRGLVAPGRHEMGGGQSSLARFDPGQMAESMEFKEAKQEVLDAFERDYLSVLIERHRGNITRAADQAGLTRYHLRELLKKHELGGK
jgi:DNA-binding NtrC family response regulator